MKLGKIRLKSIVHQPPNTHGRSKTKVILDRRTKVLLNLAAGQGEIGSALANANIDPIDQRDELERCSALLGRRGRLAVREERPAAGPPPETREGRASRSNSTDIYNINPQAGAHDVGWRLEGDSQEPG